jgi:hypothetical protein
MILCFALGIANIFTFNVVIIIFSVLCLSVPPVPFYSPPFPHLSSHMLTYLPHPSVYPPS